MPQLELRILKNYDFEGIKYNCRILLTGFDHVITTALRISKYIGRVYRVTCALCFGCKEEKPNEKEIIVRNVVNFFVKIQERAATV